jgi:hypothetical protein
LRISEPLDPSLDGLFDAHWPQLSADRRRAYAVALVRYTCANVSGVSPHEESAWEAALGEPADAAIGRLAARGLLAAATTESALASQSKTTIVAMLRERSLKVSGTKTDGAKRLVLHDEAKMRALAETFNLIECTPTGRLIAEAFLDEERLAKDVAHADALFALSSGQLEMARVIADAFDQRRVIKPGAMFSMKSPAEVLPLILELTPSILHELSDSSWSTVRLGAAMQHLFGDRVGSWLPRGVINHPRLDDEACCRMLEFAASHMAKLATYRKSGIVTGVQVLSGTGSCDACVRDTQIVYPLSKAPSLPHGDCTCKIGCPCCLVAITTSRVSVTHEI